VQIPDTLQGKIEQEDRTTWPSPQDYNESIQNPAFCFADEQLRHTEAELNIIGLPKPASGNFASVYHLRNEQGEWAVRCFLHQVSDQQERYAALSQLFSEHKLPYFATFDFIEQGIRVGNCWYPILKMEWVKGNSLLEYVEANLGNTEVLKQLAKNFKLMVLELQECGIAHGDLQHGNIMITSTGEIKLVDYDACFVPTLQGKQSNELGHRNYQHPQRRSHNFDAGIDNFSAWLIWVSLHILSEDPLLWDRLQCGDEYLLLKQDDMINSRYSRAFHLLEFNSNRNIPPYARFLRHLLRVVPAACPALASEMVSPSDLPLLEAIVKPSNHSNASENSNGKIRQAKETRADAKNFLSSIMFEDSLKRLRGAYKSGALATLPRIVLSNVLWLNATSPAFLKVIVAVLMVTLIPVITIANLKKTEPILIQRHDANTPRALFVAGMTLADGHNYTQAIANFEKCIELNQRGVRSQLLPTEIARAWFYLGQIKVNTGDFRGGMLNLQKSQKMFLSLRNAKEAKQALLGVQYCAKRIGDYSTYFVSSVDLIDTRNTARFNAAAIAEALQAAQLDSKASSKQNEVLGLDAKILLEKIQSQEHWRSHDQDLLRKLELISDISESPAVSNGEINVLLEELRSTN